MLTYHSHGKLLITGEYLVLDGAMALAVPTKLGQSLTVRPISQQVIQWKSTTVDQKTWLDLTLNLDQISGTELVDKNLEYYHVLLALRHIYSLKPSLFEQHGYLMQSHLEFPTNWGLGSSSTLINNLAQWANVNPYTLNDEVFGGSGYDIACANSDGPIYYQRLDGESTILSAPFEPEFHESLWFVHMNNKQNSRDSIRHYAKKGPADANAIQEVNEIAQRLTRCQTLELFCELIERHETIISSTIGLPKISETLFPDFSGTLKSLGGWGGDYVLATGSENAVRSYFEPKGFKTVQAHHQLIKI